jgi:hypothetical protein
MKLRLTAVTTSILAVGLSAQKTSPLKTATDYGTTASAGKANDSNSVKKGTAGKPGLASRSMAREGSGRTATASASASSSAQAIASKTAAGVVASEMGSAQTTEAKGSASAGTTTTKGGKAGAAHAITWTGTVKPNTKGTLTIAFTNRRTTAAGATMNFAVKVDGKDVAKFSGKGKTSRKSTPFTTGSKGLTITITSSGSAAVKAKGSAGYSGSVSVTFSAGGGGGGGSNCAAMRPYGRGCGAGLTGKVTPGKTDNTLSLTTRNIPKDAPTVLILGKANAKGIKVPGSRCMIYADPTTVVAWKNPSSAKFTFKAGRAVALGIQAAFLAKVRNSTTLGTTNAVSLSCKDAKK